MKLAERLGGLGSPPAALGFKGDQLEGGDGENVEDAARGHCTWNLGKRHLDRSQPPIICRASLGAELDLELYRRDLQRDVPQ